MKYFFENRAAWLVSLLGALGLFCHYAGNDTAGISCIVGAFVICALTEERL